MFNGKQDIVLCQYINLKSKRVDCWINERDNNESCKCKTNDILMQFTIQKKETRKKSRRMTF